ncbi:MAG: SIR2 family protein [Minicystis sp.]
MPRRPRGILRWTSCAPRTRAGSSSCSRARACRRRPGCRAGSASWKLLAERARVTRRADADALAEIADLAAHAEYIDALSAAKAALGPSEFGAVVEQHLDDALADDPGIAKAIAALAPKLRAVLTTNIDHLLERAFAGKWPAIARATGDVARREKVILKLHGTLLERATWVFTREEYDRAMYADPNLSAAFSALFHACPILFVGYGLKDDDFDHLLGRVRAFAGLQPPRHFALVDAKEVTPYRRKRLEDGGVRLIPYENPDGRHRAVVEILRDIPAPPPKRPAVQAAVPRRLGRAEVMALLEPEGVRDLASFRDEHLELKERPIWMHTSGSEPYVRALRRLLGILVMDVVPAGALGLFNKNNLPTKSDRRAIEVVVGIPREGPFVVALSPAAIVPLVAPNLGALAIRVARLGGIVRVYGLADADVPTSMEGIEVVRSIEDALRPLVRDSLRAHAAKCVDAWTDERERRFVEGRARCLGEADRPVGHAIDEALQQSWGALLLGDFGTGKSTQMARRAAHMARDFLADEQRFPAPLLLALTGIKPDLDAILAHHIEGVPIEAIRLAVDLGMAVPILDGLDELALPPGPPETSIAALLSAFDAPRPQVILTSRKLLFAPAAERVGYGTGASPKLAVVELQALDRAEVTAFVEKATPSAEEAERTLESIERTHDSREPCPAPGPARAHRREPHQALATGDLGRGALSDGDRGLAGEPARSGARRLACSEVRVRVFACPGALHVGRRERDLRRDRTRCPRSARRPLRLPGQTSARGAPGRIPRLR